MTVTMTCPVCGEILFDLAPEKRGMGMPCSRCGAALFFPGELGENTPQEEQAVTVPSEEEVRRIGTIWEADPDTDFELDLRVVDAALADSDAVLMDDEGDAPPSTEDSAWLIELNKREGELHSDSDVDAEPALEREFGDRVPVLFAGDPADGAELCHFRLDYSRHAIQRIQHVFATKSGIK